MFGLDFVNTCITIGSRFCLRYVTLRRPKLVTIEKHTKTTQVDLPSIFIIIIFNYLQVVIFNKFSTNYINEY